MALGDSITAGFGMDGTSGDLNEFRGQSWSIGGDPNATTLANFFRFYNPQIRGASLGTHMIELCYGPLCPPYQYRPSKDVLNSAQSGAMVEDLLQHEMTYLVQQLKSLPGVDFQNDWKHLTLLIGANDLCAACILENYLGPDDFEKNLVAVLEAVRMNVPRVFVSVVEMFNLSQVYDLSLKTPKCVTVHRDFAIECDCLFRKNGNLTRELVDSYVQAYNARSVGIAKYYQSQQYADFTVVAQPFGRNTMLKEFPPDALSTLDCFHPSLITHRAMAVALWNNLITPSANKKTFLNLTDTPLCPTPDTLLYTS